MVVADFNYEPMLEMFVFETGQLLEQLEDILLKSEGEKSFSKDSVDEIFRIMHTIKGSSAMMMFNNISSVAHTLEDFFHFIRESGELKGDFRSVGNVLFESLDFIKNEVSEIQDGKGAATDSAELVSKITRLLACVKGESAGEPCFEDSAGQEKKSEPEQAAAPEAPAVQDRQGKYSYTARVLFEDDCQMANIRAFNVVHNLEDICTGIAHQPADLFDSENAPREILADGLRLSFSTDAEYDDVFKIIVQTQYIKNVELKKEDAAAPEKEAAAAAAATADPAVKQEKEEQQKTVKQAANLISVNVAKLDKLMDLVGEIVITESMVTRNPDLAGLELESFSKASRQLRKLTDELQDIVMSIRMIPVAGVFNKMYRIVRDMSLKLNKDVELVILGEETEVDKNIIENLSDPLMHLIRNAMDHGIENKEERKKKGKNEKGRITIEARNTGGDVIITVSDDGKGLDKAKILKKAKENGLLTKPEGEMLDKEIYSIILMPGFSTKEKVTEFSGRGVGMDVVKRNIEKVGGSVSVESVPGAGTSVVIKIPLTLAIIDGMEISVGGQVLTLPTVSIIESFRPEKNQVILDPDGDEMIMIRDRCHPVVRLHREFNIPTKITSFDEGILILVESDGSTLCLFADELLGEQQVVVKSLPTYLLKYAVKDKTGIGGCTILGDGNISLIIDISELIKVFS